MIEKTPLLPIGFISVALLVVGCAADSPPAFNYTGDAGIATGPCESGATQLGPTDCGLNQRGAYQQTCDDTNTWVDSVICVDPDTCIDGQTTIGDTDCETASGKLEQLCVLGQWEDTAICSSTRECVDRSERQVGICGENGDKTFHERCVDGFWEEPGTCLFPEECIDGSLRRGAKPCGSGTPPRGYWTEECQGNTWVEVDCHDMDLDIGGPCTCLDGEDSNCQDTIPVVNEMMRYFWDINIDGCDYVKEKYADWPNVEVTCMRSQKGRINPQFWANGYCTLASVGCSGNTTMCNLIPTGGDYLAHTSCPPGTVLLEEKFYTPAMNFTLYNKLCLQSCETDEDCRYTEADPIHDTPSPAYKCFVDNSSGRTVKFCWDEQNLTSVSHAVTQF